MTLAFGIIQDKIDNLHNENNKTGMGFDRITKLIRTIGMVLFNLILFFLFIEYIQVNIYSYPTASFTGNTFTIRIKMKDVSNWIKANFHAHSNHWKGIFNGNQSEDEIVKVS